MLVSKSDRNRSVLAVLITFPSPKNLYFGRVWGRCRPDKEPFSAKVHSMTWNGIWILVFRLLNQNYSMLLQFSCFHLKPIFYPFSISSKPENPKRFLQKSGYFCFQRYFSFVMSTIQSIQFNPSTEEI